MPSKEIQLEEPVLQSNFSDHLEKLLKAIFPIEQVQQFFANSSALLDEFVRLKQHECLYMYSNPQSELECSLEYNFNPIFEHICIRKTLSSLIVMWIPADTSVEEIFNAYVNGFSNYIQNYSQCNMENDRKTKQSISNIVKKVKEMEYCLSSIHNIHNLPLLPSFSLPPKVQSIYEQNSTELSQYYELFELEQPVEIIHEVQQCVASWIIEVQKITKIVTKNLSFDCLSNEASYWSKFESLLIKLDEAMKETKICFCLELLKRAKKFHLTVGFFIDCGVKEALEFVQEKKLLFRDIPLEQLYSIDNWNELKYFIVELFNQFDKKVRNSNISIEFLIQLTDLVWNEVHLKMLSFSSKSIGVISLKEILQEIRNLTLEWDSNVKQLQNDSREIVHKKTAKFSSFKFNLSHVDFLNIIMQLNDAIYEFVKIEKEFQNSTELYTANFNLKSKSILDSLHDCITSISNPNLFSNDFDEKAKTFLNNYCNLMESFDESTIENLKELFMKNTSVENMMNIFEQFHHVLSRPKIEASFEECRNCLLKHFDNELINLGHSCNVTCNQDSELDLLRNQFVSEQNKFQQLDEIEVQLTKVFGQNWSIEPWCSSIQTRICTLKNESKLEQLAENMMVFMKEHAIRFKGVILAVNKTKHEIVLSLDFCFIRELKNCMDILSNSNIVMPLELLTFLKDIERIFPYACKLNQLFSQYNHLIAKTKNDYELFCESIVKVQNKIKACIRIRWEILTIYDPNTHHNNRHFKLIDAFENSLLELKSRQEKYLNYKEHFDFQLDQFKNSTNLNLFWEAWKILETISQDFSSEVEDFDPVKDEKINLLVFVWEKIFARNLGEFVIPTEMSINDTMQYFVNWYLNYSIDENAMQILTHDFNQIGDSILKRMQQERFQTSEFLQMDVLIRILDFDKNELKDLKQLSRFLSSGEFNVKFGELQSIKQIQAFNELKIISSTNLNSCWSNFLPDTENSMNDKNQISSHIKEQIVNFYMKKIEILVDSSIEQLQPIYEQAVETERKVFMQALPTENLSNSDLNSNDYMNNFVKLMKFKQNKAQMEALHQLLTVDVPSKIKIEPYFQKALEIEKDFDENTVEIYANLEDALLDLLIAADKSYNSLRSKFPSKKSFSLNVQQIYTALQQDSELLNELLEFTGYIQFVSSMINDTNLGSFGTSSEVPCKSDFAFRNDSLDKLSKFNSKDILSFAVEFKEIYAIWSFIFHKEKSLHASLDCEIVGFSCKQAKNVLNSLKKQFDSFVFNPKYSQLVGDYRRRLLILENQSVILDELQDSIVLVEVTKRISNVFPSLSLNTVASFILSELFSSNFKTIQETIVAIMDELEVKKSFTQLKRNYFDMKLECIPYSSIEIISNFKQIFIVISELFTSIESTKVSAYLSCVDSELCSLEIMLKKTRVSVAKMQDLQKSFIHMEKYFSSNEILQKRLEFENTKFIELCKLFSRLIELVKVNFPQCTCEDSFCLMLEESITLISAIEDGVNFFISSIRAEFPRLYFLSDQDLLHFFSSKSHKDGLQLVISKLFPSIRQLQFQDSSIVGLVSQQNEQLIFKSEIIPQSNPFAIVQQLDESIKSTLKSVLVSNLDFYLENFTKRKVFLFKKEIPFQVCQLILQISYSQSLSCDKKGLQKLSKYLEQLSGHFYKCKDEKQKYQNLLLEIVRQQVEIGWILSDKEEMKVRFDSALKWSLNGESGDVCLRILGFSISYGFEYLGIYEKIVDTPVTCHFYRVMVAAIANQYGGCPFGPAGTGKTEAVKALGHMLGKQVHVFNCNESFDYSSITKIMKGLVSFGAWGCFDEINRLDVENLSCIADFIASIQHELRSSKDVGLSHEESATAELDAVSSEHQVGSSCTQGELANVSSKSFYVHPETAIFTTLNPVYSGRVSLPANLSSLFRSFCLNSPDIFDIVRGTMYINDIQDDQLVMNFVQLFEQCSQKISPRDHYDFGLRTIKTIMRIVFSNNQSAYNKDDLYSRITRLLDSTIAPRLYTEDLAIFRTLLQQTFQSALQTDAGLEPFIHCEDELKIIFQSKYSNSPIMLEKLFLIHNLFSLYDGCIFYGASGSLKSSHLNAYLDVFYPNKFQIFHLEPSSLSIGELIGSLEDVTQKWKDGIIPQIFRTINEENSNDFHYIIHFDGPAYSEWMENFNSLFDDNRFLSLPSGETIQLPRNLKFVFETDSIVNITKATFTRCGLMYFPSISTANGTSTQMSGKNLSDIESKFFTTFHSWLEGKDLQLCLDLDNSVFASNYKFILGALLRRFDKKSSPVVIQTEKRDQSYSLNVILFALFHSIFNLLDGKLKKEFVEFFASQLSNCFTANQVIDFKGNFQTLIPCAKNEKALLDFHLIPTVESMRMEYLISTLLDASSNILLCGPSGSGKTLTILNYLQSASNSSFDSLMINFSKNSSLNSLIQALFSRCNLVKYSENDYSLIPKNDKPLIVFIDEINLPQPDSLGYFIISNFFAFVFEYSGFWYNSKWIQLRKLKFVAACNPTTDSGRFPLGKKLLKNFCVFWVDECETDSLLKIYSTMLHEVFRPFPLFRHLAEPYAQAMINFYGTMKTRFTTNQQCHYVYSARELTKWVSGFEFLLHEVVNDSFGNFKKSSDLNRPSFACSEGKLGLDEKELHRIFMFEACRVFIDRLVNDESKHNAVSLLKNAFADFACIEFDPLNVWYCNWISAGTRECSISSLLPVLEDKMKLFLQEGDGYSQALSFIACEDILKRVLRISRILSRPLGHLIMIGTLGMGKSFSVKLACWMNGIECISVAMHSTYSLEMFDSELRHALRRVIRTETPICFYMDCISYQVSSSFIERINVILANGEVFDLFDETELQELMSTFEAETIRSRVCRFFHAVISIQSNVNQNSMKESMNASPALFTRCVIDWLGDWSQTSIKTTANAIIQNTDIPNIEEFFSLNILPIYRRIERDNFGCSNNCILPYQLIEMTKIFVAEYERSRDLMIKAQIRTSNALNLLSNCQQSTASFAQELNEQKEILNRQQSTCDRKLEEMVQKQRESEHEKLACNQLKDELSKKRFQITQQSEKVKGQLDEVLPLIEQARASVKEIKKQQLVELKSMNSPPESVKITLEAVCLLLGFSFDSWRSIQAIIRKDDFISNVINFSVESISGSLVARIRNIYFSNAQFTFEKANYASKACGPLLNWVTAQVKYAEINETVAPLQQEITQLQQDALQNENKLQENEDKISALMIQIDQIKLEYSSMMQHLLTIKSNIECISGKLERSELLFKSLESEQSRWNCTTEEFKQKLIEFPLVVWNRIAQLFLPTASFSSAPSEIFNGNSFISHDSKLLEACNWSQEIYQKMDSLLFFSNNHLVPLIVDDSKEETTLSTLAVFLSPRKFQVVSFHQDNWFKCVENAMLFGNILILKDAHLYDTILNPILLNEFCTFGGKKAISFPTFSDSDKKSKIVPISTGFKLFLFSQNKPKNGFLESFAKMVDFSSTTLASLQSVCLDVILKKRNPELFEKKIKTICSIETLKITLLQAEDELLQRLSTDSIVLNTEIDQSTSKATPSFLDNSNLIQALTRTKEESNKLNEDLESNLKIMSNINTLSMEYQEIAHKFGQLIFEIFHSDLLNREEIIFSVHTLIDYFKNEFTNNDEIENVLVNLFQLSAMSLSADNSLSLLLIIWNIFYSSPQKTENSSSFDQSFPENYKQFIEMDLLNGKFKKASLSNSLYSVLSATSLICIMNITWNPAILIRSLAGKVLQTNSVVTHSLGQSMNHFEQKEKINNLLINYKLIILNNCELDINFIESILVSHSKLSADSSPKIIFLTKCEFHFSLIQLIKSMHCKSCLLFNESTINLEPLEESSLIIPSSKWFNNPLLESVVHFYNSLKFKEQFFPFGGFISNYSFSQQDLQYLDRFIIENSDNIFFISVEFVFGPLIENPFDFEVMKYFLRKSIENISSLQLLTKQSISMNLFVRKRAEVFWKLNSKITKFNFTLNSNKNQIISNSCSSSLKSILSSKPNNEIILLKVVESVASKSETIEREDMNILQLFSLNFHSSIDPVEKNEFNLVTFNYEFVSFNPNNHRLIPLFFDGIPFNSRVVLVCSEQKNSPDYSVNCCLYC